MKWTGGIGGPGEWTPSSLADGCCTASEEALQSMLCSRWTCSLASRVREAPGRSKMRGPTVDANETPLAVGHLTIPGSVPSSPIVFPPGSVAEFVSTWPISSPNPITSAAPGSAPASPIASAAPGSAPTSPLGFLVAGFASASPVASPSPGSATTSPIALFAPGSASASLIAFPASGPAPTPPVASPLPVSTPTLPIVSTAPGSAPASPVVFPVLWATA